MEIKLTRREFIEDTARYITSASFLNLLLPDVIPTNFLFGDEQKKRTSIVVAKNASPQQLLKATLKEFGGLKRVISRGDVVVVKPNISWDRRPEFAATTNPELIGELVKLCLEAGAKKVRVFDNTCQNPRRAADSSGIKDAVKKAGGSFEFINKFRFVETKLPKAKALKKWPLYKDALEADCIINVPIAKHHSLTQLTMCMKHLMGLCGGNRGNIHTNISQKLVDLSLFFSESNLKLNILDAYRILTKGGPQGGNLTAVKLRKTIILSTDIVAVDAYGSTLFNKKPHDLDYIKLAHEQDVGESDLSKIDIKEVDLRRKK